MEKFYLEEVNLDRKDDVTDYVSEFIKYNSDIYGTGGFHHILDGDSFESILEKEMSLHDTDYALSVGMCPGKTFLLIRENDNKLIGMMMNLLMFIGLILRILLKNTEIIILIIFIINGNNGIIKIY